MAQADNHSISFLPASLLTKRLRLHAVRARHSALRRAAATGEEPVLSLHNDLVRAATLIEALSLLQRALDVISGPKARA